MKKKFFSKCALLCALLAVLLLNSCIGLDKLVGGLYYTIRSKTETRPLGAFTSIEIVGGGQLDLHQGTQELIVTADCDDIANVRTTVMGTRLIIDASQLAGQGMAPYFKITLPTLEELVSTSCYCNLYDFSGTSFSCTVHSGTVNLIGLTLAGLTYATIALNASGGGFNAQIVASSLSCTLSGDGGVFLSGSADSASFVVSDQGWVNTTPYVDMPTYSPFTAANATVFNSGAGSVLLRATNTLDATITGSGNIYYWGTPTITQNITGTGLLIKKD
jgi:hypothetical protein